ncbi:MAG: sodium:proton antiporter [Clostridia bacterium]|nr:sodium:proton antiporter [Clostridia bacterium]
MPLWQSIPFASVMLPLAGAAVTAALPPRASRRWAGALMAVVWGLSVGLIVCLLTGGGSFTYPMGHLGAPWGNELRAGPLEALLASLFSGVMLLSLLGGADKLREDLTPGRQPFYSVLLLLTLAALMAQVYTNDLFTAYVFVEIITLCGCGLIAARSGTGKSLSAAARYMVMNLIASALFLLGVILLYDLTGHLLMDPLRGAVQVLAADPARELPLTMVVALLCVSLAIKGALWPFHTWVPDAYSTATPTGAAVLSSLVCKAYLILLLKVLTRVITPEVLAAVQADQVLFLLGIAGMLMGSLHAIHQRELRRMIAWSSVAQVGYIFMGFGLRGGLGMGASVFHMVSHAVCKSMLFLAADALIRASEGHEALRNLRGAGHRAPLAGVCLSAGLLSLVGIPLLGGFVSKLNFVQAAIAAGGIREPIALAALAVSTLLHIFYCVRAVLLIWSQPEQPLTAPAPRIPWRAGLALGALLVLNLALGCLAPPVWTVIQSGLAVIG